MGALDDMISGLGQGEAELYLCDYLGGRAGQCLPAVLAELLHLNRNGALSRMPGEVEHAVAREWRSRNLGPDEVRDLHRAVREAVRTITALAVDDNSPHVRWTVEGTPYALVSRETKRRVEDQRRGAGRSTSDA